MGSAITDWACGTYLSMLTGQLAVPSTMYVALASTEPGENASGDDLALIEPSSSLGYARVSITNNNTFWSDPADFDYSVSLTDVNFPTATTDDWGSYTHFAVCDAATSGNVYFYGEFDSPVYISLGLAFTIPAGGIIISFGSFIPALTEQ